MILKIGSKSFTLVEIMISLCIFLSGIVFIYHGLFKVIKYFSYYQNCILVLPYFNQKIWEAEDSLKRERKLYIEEKEALDLKNFFCKIESNLVNYYNNLYKIKVSISWKQGKENINLIRFNYVLVPKEKF